MLKVQSAIKNSLATMPGVDSDSDSPVADYVESSCVDPFKRKRAKYEKKIQERCAVTKANLFASIKASVETRVLDHLARFILRRNLETVTDADIVAEIERKCGTILNALCQMSWDIETRISKYFVDFDRLVEEKSFIGVLGSNMGGQVPDPQKMKLSCRILVENLAPTVLQVDVKRLVEMTHRDARTDDVRLYQLIRETKELRAVPKTRAATTAAAKTTAVKTESGDAVKPKPSVKASVERKRQCWVCKGGHKMRESPAATDAEKDAAPAAWRGQRKSQLERAKNVAEGINKKAVLVNGNLEIPLCPDMGWDRNIISCGYLNELQDPDAEVTTAPLGEMITVKATGGAEFVCREGATLDLKLTTAGGTEDKFPLGRVTLKEIGIDIDHLLEQLANGLVDGLQYLINEFFDIFRFHIGNDPPADVEPLEVQVVPGATPFRCNLRKYPERQRAFLREYVQQLVNAGLVRHNNDNRWACATLPVKKANNEYRMTIDYHPVNRSTVPPATATPNLAVVTQSMKGASDSALHFQAQMQDCFPSLLYNAIWRTSTISCCLPVLEKLRAFFIILRQHNLKDQRDEVHVDLEEGRLMRQGDRWDEY
ncbi:hypothetical protein PHMEG_00014584 [Phytophthora megakarya]|uniref:Reverse transcriptase n=1 Tax=Phytophthora megakarya TaxID=4795 RepID=A0A225W3Y6_9STRA|nr:hypothetical protein PHMEG_00014584 [Phytophthora megakarya]